MTIKTLRVFGLLFTLTMGLTSLTAASFAQKPPPNGGGPDLHESQIKSAGAYKMLGEVWVDNWFRLWVNGTALLEDSVSLTTERSFNAERFEFNTNLPMTLAFEFRDFMENETGLEYVGTRRQQLGDGGAIAQFKDASSGRLLTATGADWKCLTVQSAPADATCARERKPDPSLPVCAQRKTAVPENWTSPDFDDSAWPAASVHSAREVGPKDGYDRITWGPSAELIWGPDLKTDNIVYCRVTVGR
ncbi:hypothetical protein SIAM614_06073 [Stappia aggregata IAM 12614]|uniref:PEBP family protein n=1 Tax=Roseibium aggregatum (strain ATCC 25650 / DSM 13394 / JCM 20685 / NBRC 16684 / NCIMB 2208 / IAM 12614 / B1) TaxID=384765 RepID=A0NV60_ROSAI|nr:hypothetical protein [Roseibium aggregatum]EAV43327.1 hypothetical protein SIAM614_06073 [Stappia aggregata IAM 12614] [Roseibium aggregatum IAM 12614]